MPDSKSVLTDEVLTWEKVCISDREMGVELIVFKMSDFDVILRIDFLEFL